MKMKKSLGGKIFDVCNYVFLLLLAISTIYPFLFVLASSLSDPYLLNKHYGLLLFPRGFTLRGYELTLRNPDILLGYRNTIIYVSFGTLINIVMTSMGAYVLSRRRVAWVKYFMVLIVITIFFNGGLIPTFILIRSLGMLNMIWAMVVPGAIAVWNLIVMRTSFMAIPESLSESAKMDGANDFTIFIRIILPISMPVVAVMILFYAVGHWNSWFNAVVFLRNRRLFPLQLFLREFLIENREQQMVAQSLEINLDLVYKKLLRYTTIMVATLPILFAYPFLQRYFVKGVMIGALKG